MARKQTSENKSVMTSAAAPAPARRPAAPAKRAPRAAAAKTVKTEVPQEISTPAATAPTFEEISRLAHSYWEARGCVDGSPEQDWLRAERELAGK
jgi:hypothetical protein